jgi:type II protein arginine methyltransferase
MKVTQEGLAKLLEMSASVEDRPLAQVNLARAILAAGEEDKARDLAHMAMRRAPQDPQVRVLAAEVLSHGVPDWHFDLVRDEARNHAYDAALRRMVRPGTKVLEIGTGSGILAMMAARAGATEVITCEANPALAAVARVNIRQNGYADRIRVVVKHSYDLDPSDDLGGPADLLVSEIVSNDVLGQRVLAVLDDAHRRLLRPGADVIPLGAVARVALAQSEQIAQSRIERVDGFDLSALNDLAPPMWKLRAGDPQLTLSTAPEDLFAFNFQSGLAHASETASVTLRAEEGPANCIVQWMQLRMDSVGLYENAPGTGATSCWAVLAYPLRRPISLERGEQVVVHGSHDRVEMRLWTDRS